jgi:predicted neuraminidase
MPGPRRLHSPARDAHILPIGHGGRVALALRRPAIASLACFSLLLFGLFANVRADELLFVRSEIFPANPKHNHASCVVETKPGRLLAVWYSGSGERKADDVVIEGAWRNRGDSRWGRKFLMADTPGYPDCNPALFAAPDGSLWLFWPTILDHHWEGALLKYARCDRPGDESGPPRWSRTGVLHVTPRGFAADMKRAIAGLDASDKKRYRNQLDEDERRSGDELYQRLGWMPRVHAVALPSGRWLLPLYSDTFSASIMAISEDRGQTWLASRPLIGFGNIQPSLVRRNDGVLVAFMRDNGPHRRIRLSTSKDDGLSWSSVTDSPFPNPGAGIEAIRLANGHWLLVYNDTAVGRHSLAIAVSADEGATWKWTRHLERALPGQGQFHYPSVIQAADGSIHVTYTYRLKGQGSTIEHVQLNEAWLLAKDQD